MYKFNVPKEKQVRVIVDTDAKNEADDQYAIVHALLTPKFNIKGIVASHFGTRRTRTSMEESYEECVKLLDLMERRGRLMYLEVLKKQLLAKENMSFPKVQEG